MKEKKITPYEWETITPLVVEEIYKIESYMEKSSYILQQITIIEESGSTVSSNFAKSEKDLLIINAHIRVVLKNIEFVGFYVDKGTSMGKEMDMDEISLFKKMFGIHKNKAVYIGSCFGSSMIEIA